MGGTDGKKNHVSGKGGTNVAFVCFAGWLVCVMICVGGTLASLWGSGHLRTFGTAAGVALLFAYGAGAVALVVWLAAVAFFGSRRQEQAEIHTDSSSSERG